MWIYIFVARGSTHGGPCDKTSLTMTLVVFLWFLEIVLDMNFRYHRSVMSLGVSGGVASFIGSNNTQGHI